MSTKELLEKIKYIAENHVLVNSANIDDVYDLWNGKEMKYPSVNIALESVDGDVNNNLLTYNVVIYYGDRLMQDKANLVDIQSDAVRVLNSIVNNIYNIDEVGDEEFYSITLFEQQFADYLAGGYVRLQISLETEFGGCSLDSINIDD